MITLFPKISKTSISAAAFVGVFSVSAISFVSSNTITVENQAPAQTENVTTAEIANDTATTTLLFVGDIMLSREIGSIMKRKKDWNYPFILASSTLQSADLTFGNLEGPISSGGIKVGSKYSFEADPQVVSGLKAAGFDVLSLANNHMWDYGSVAFNDTLKILDDNAIGHVGAGRTYDEVHAPVVKEVNGVKIAYLAYTNLLPASLGTKGDKATVANFDKEQLILDIQNAKQLADIVVASFHWGEEYKTTHNAAQEELAHFAIDNGADLVIGHHPHVAQDIEGYGKGYVAYSLGNFVFDQNFSPDTGNALIVAVLIKNKKIVEVNPQRIEFNATYQPFLAPIK